MGISVTLGSLGGTTGGGASTGFSVSWSLGSGCTVTSSTVINKERRHFHNCSDVIMNAMASQINSVSIVCSIICSGAGQRKHQSFASLAFVRGIHWRPVDASHKGPVTGKCFHLMTSSWLQTTGHVALTFITGTAVPVSNIFKFTEHVKLWQGAGIVTVKWPSGDQAPSNTITSSEVVHGCNRYFPVGIRHNNNIITPKQRRDIVLT